MNDPISRPPPLPENHNPTLKRNAGGLFSRFGTQFAPAEGDLTFFGIIDSLLKRPGRIAYAIVHGDTARVCLALLTLITICMAAYGFLMGTFSGGPQLWVVPVKVCLGILLSALLCLPSLYIFACLSGGRLSLPHIAALLLQSLALSALLLAGFAPVMWIFSQSTSAAGFMGLLHLLFWIISIGFALELLYAGVEFIHQESLPILRIWGVIFILVVFQMCTFIRPLVGEFKGYGLQPKQFFLSHWMDVADGK